MAKEEGGEAIPAREYEDKAKANLLSVFGLEHTHDTKVGDACEYSRSPCQMLL
jgi:hypothetical protein